MIGRRATTYLFGGNSVRSWTSRFFSTNKEFDAMVFDAIQSNQVVIFSKSYCPYCTNTKNLFLSLNIQSKIFELDLMDSGKDIQLALERLTHQRTVPNVFVHGQHIGGNDDTVRAKMSGKLEQLLSLKSH